MAQRRMISADLLYSDEFMALSYESKVLYIYSLIETDADGIFKGLNRLLSDTKTKQEHLEELLDNNFFIKYSAKPLYAITDFHIMNRMDKNSKTNENKYTPTKHMTFKNQLFVTEDSTLTLNEEDGFMPYRLYEGGSMSKVLESYRAQLEAQRIEDGKQENDADGLSELDKKIMADNPQYFKDKDE